MNAALIDYGAGNLASVLKALRALDVVPRVVRSAGDLAKPSLIIVPGVGHFEATRAIDDGMRQELRRAIERGAALLGICLGLQWFFDGSDEAPGVHGLGVFTGRCFDLRAQATSAGLKVPHVGWNRISSGETVYFSHTYAAPVVPETKATADHGATFSAVVRRGQVAAVQFHPELSGRAGLRILGDVLMAQEAACSPGA